jgi:hypothetical protein
MYLGFENGLSCWLILVQARNISANRVVHIWVCGGVDVNQSLYDGGGVREMRWRMLLREKDGLSKSI